MWISAPEDLYGTKYSLSDISHINEIYTQLTDGTRDCMPSNVTCDEMISETIKGCDSKSFSLHMIELMSSVVGDKSGDINNILENNGFYAENYKYTIVSFMGQNYSSLYNNFSILVKSIKNESGKWVWDSLGVHQWN